MTDAVGDRPVILVNPRLKVLPPKLYLSFPVYWGTYDHCYHAQSDEILTAQVCLFGWILG